MPEIDIETGFRALILQATGLPAANVGVWPAFEVSERLDYVSVEVLDGSADALETEPVVEINVWAASNARAKSLHQTISAAILGYPRSVMVGERRFVLDSPRCTRIPTREEWDDSEVRRVSAMYSSAVRR